MIDRYSRAEMSSLWTDEAKWSSVLDVEIAVSEAQAKLGWIPKEAAKSIAKKAKFDINKIAEIEKTTKHDVIAFVTNVAESVGEHGRFLHFGLTSSDVLDTGLSLQIQKAGMILKDGLKKLKTVLKKISLAEAETLCAGRTHGMHAEITSFGYKMSGFLQELDRHSERITKSIEDCRFGKLSGAVGAYSFLDTEFEAEVCKLLKLNVEPVATQVIPRDRHASLFTTFGLLAGWIERLAIELRHLQRTELGEVIEEFTKGQKGSSAMPHKKNPISAENLTGLARLLRSYVYPALENQALWHERDISHSSVERVILPDAFIVLDYAIYRMTQLLSGLSIQQERMEKNIELSQGNLYSSFILSAMVKSGATRDDAYAKIQKVSHSLKPGENLLDKLKLEKDVLKLMTTKSIKKRFKLLVERAVKDL